MAYIFVGKGDDYGSILIKIKVERRARDDRLINDLMNASIMLILNEYYCVNI